MKKTYKTQLYTLQNGKDIFIDVILEDNKVTDIIAGEDIKYENYHIKKGDIINSNGEESLIRSEDIEVAFLEN